MFSGFKRWFKGLKTDSFENEPNKLTPMGNSGSDTSINDEKEKKKLVEAEIIFSTPI